MKHKIIGAIALGAAFFAVGTTAQASSHSTIPTKLRGTWYQPSSSKSYSVMGITTHTVSLWTANNSGKRTSKKTTVLTSSAKNYKQLYVTKSNAFSKNRYWYQLPNINKQIPGGFTDDWGFWTYTKKIGSKKYSVLGTYQRQGYVDAYSKTRTHHNFSYTANSQKAMDALGYKK
ncbi:hypothetical protein [Secundilactobacillus paracollinoides]|uniref:hypothetical protein n=1 Tax=Secundilactobacillus paracollinoides TaxID=240427 RepID=UPI0006D03999|nr:hypothetical protein [Secundilactobacillus paracollinoides]KRL78847.1 hypothetical protein FC17_GL000863 [Secundilactobacillus paracollinoides DSM 15502 = JCM 11969]